MLSTLSAYKNFITTSVTATQAGTGSTIAPSLDIVTDDDASSNINQVLVGGPVANSLVASLVTAGSSTVEWASSDGDIEVVADAPASGYSSIIVAGATRTETAAAAQALADAL
jgi:S-layer protein (TIGR01564 family)